MGGDLKLFSELLENNEQHQKLVEAHSYLQSAATYYGSANLIEGNESFTETLKQLGSDVGTKLLKAGNWAGGQALTALKTGFSKVNKELNFCFASNQTLIKKLSTGIGKLSDIEELSITAEQVANITSDGNLNTLIKDRDELIDVCKVIKQHTEEVNVYLEKSLIIFKRLASVRNDGEALEIYNDFVSLQYPKLKLDYEKSNGMYATKELPAGKVITVTFKEGGNVSYSMSGSKPSGTPSSLDMSKDEIKHFIDKLNPINELHKTLITANEYYLKFSANWASAVKSVSSHLDDTNSISSTVCKDLESIMHGNANCLAFYSGFTPRLSTYVNKYIRDVLNIMSKLI